MGAGTSSLIDDLHTSAQMPDELSVNRKLDALTQVQKLGDDPVTAMQIVEQGGMQPLLRCYNASHPMVRVEAAKALAILAHQPSNQLEMGRDDVLPQCATAPRPRRPTYDSWPRDADVLPHAARASYHMHAAGTTRRSSRRRSTFTSRRCHSSRRRACARGPHPRHGTPPPYADAATARHCRSWRPPTSTA